MFRNRVSKQYIGKSKLIFKVKTANLEFTIKGESLIGQIANILFIPGSDKKLPDYFMSGTFFSGDQPSFMISMKIFYISLEYQKIFLHLIHSDYKIRNGHHIMRMTMVVTFSKFFHIMNH